jgi:inosine/xanthosine triphosphate pyrophosphatase family protein
MGRTMAELSSQEKNAYSHRGRAALQARGILLLLAGSTGQKRS